MASILKVDTIQDQSGNNIINENAGTITIGKSGDTVNLASGATAGFGKVLQVVSATDSTSRSTSSTSFVTASNTLSVSITPSSTSSKIFIMCSTSTGVTNQAFYTIFRDATNLGTAQGMVENYFDDADGDNRSSICMSILDSPNTTSSTTYQLYFKVNSASENADIQSNNTKASITAFEIGA